MHEIFTRRLFIVEERYFAKFRFQHQGVDVCQIIGEFFLIVEGVISRAGIQYSRSFSAGAKLSRN